MEKINKNFMDVAEVGDIIELVELTTNKIIKRRLIRVSQRVVPIIINVVNSNYDKYKLESTHLTNPETEINIESEIGKKINGIKIGETFSFHHKEYQIINIIKNRE